ncbi:hypothetical protein [Aneurinibacillus migulanus]|uniref:Phage portal protein n=1 Tax=Aneurinibacillus migulanus TaxID=47500 RepID=A0A0D1YNR5_ANEMI|nr:hypothetical protein [Aneurinibacillus migulanus]KIV60282.1 hypothetical protein TS65_00405 [Aneurinibacillus migulanus]KON90519.1 hypothetical protein AF333_29000 [Aneurinibacillus migulanus]MED0894898.1 hypothetical protein [Aneurinibacillus migulanus]MED1614459.1 hypothetical protein [Aneurinibacillus migulanus]SDJ77114.1 hypothetical protein SAMN04487909_12829 [Aneurinibacillus migulanus]
MTSNEEIGSIARFCYDYYPMFTDPKDGLQQVYFVRIPQNFKVPSLYFPVPQEDDRGDTTKTYRINHRLYIKSFHNNEQKAYDAVKAISSKIQGSKYIVPLVNQSGTLTGDFLRIKRCNIKPLHEDTLFGVAQLYLEWESRYLYDQPTYEKMGKLFLTQKLKG